MPPVKPRRQEYADATRAALLASARGLFIRRGYASTSIEHVARDARVTKGALYHHFSSKTDLFVAVFEQVQGETMQRLGDALTVTADVWQAAMGALDAYLEACITPAYQRIVLEEGPVALGWQRWRDLDHQHTLPRLEHIIDALIASEQLRPQPATLLARIICAAAGEAAFAVAASDNPATERDQAARLLRELFDGLRQPQR